MNKKMIASIAVTALLTVVLVAYFAAESQSRQAGAKIFTSKQTVTVYSSRHYAADNIVFEEFTRQTGIAVKEIKGTAEQLIERLLSEGANTEADLFITVDGGVLNLAKQAEVLQPFVSEAIEHNVPQQWRDSEMYWVGLAARARVIVYAKDRVNPAGLADYEDLTDPRWKGRLLVRSSSNLYNKSLLASFIELHGERQAEQWAQGIAANLARLPEGGDRAQAKGIVSGDGDVAIMNTYYIGQMSVSEDAEEVKMAQSLGVIFPNQATSGTHMNISGVGLVKHAAEREQALRLVEFMTGKEGQSLLVQASFEFPVHSEAALPALLQSWGPFHVQQINYNQLGEYNQQAANIFQRVGWK